MYYAKFREVSKPREEVLTNNIPDSKVHGANMGPIWGRQDPGGPHVGPMNFAIWDYCMPLILGRRLGGTVIFNSLLSGSTFYEISW